MFILLRYFFNEMNILREFLAMCIILSSIDLIKKRKLFKYIIVIAIASLFHATAIIAFPLYFLYSNEFNKKTKTIISICSIFIYVFLSDVLIYFTNILGLYSNYVENRLDSYNLASLLGFIIAICIYLFYKYEFNHHKNDFKTTEIKEHSFLLNIAFVAIFFGLISYRINIFSRATIYYNIFNIIMLPNAISLIKNPRSKHICYVVIFLLFFASFATIMYLRSDWYCVTPYRFYWK